MSTNKRRGGYLATAGGVKRLKNAKRIKRYTYQQLAEAARETKDKVKRLFNPQWGNGQYKVGEEAVEAICGVLDLKPGEIVSDWYALKISLEQDEVDISNQEKKHDESYYEVLKKIEQAVENESISLDLSHMHLTEIPKQIKSLSTLKSLKLIGNNIIEIPSEIGELRNLVKLNLDSNCIEKIPKEITHLENLQELYLFENNLDLFDISITQLKKLTILSIGNNRIDFLPKKIKNMKSLKELFINNNDISSLPSELGEMTNLNILQVNHNKISCLPSEIGFLTNLEHLKCHNNRL
ncbi:MAG: leucine-rich repeat domain-containing protein, partial [Cyanobacteria bacterium J06558_2]